MIYASLTDFSLFLKLFQRCVYGWHGLETWQKVIGFIAIFIEWAFPLLVFIIAYSRILYMIRSKATSQIGEANKSREMIMQRGARNTIKMMISVALAFILCWSPNETIMLMSNLGFNIDFRSTYYMVTSVLVIMNSILNPIIYCLQYEQFRLAALELVYKVVGVNIAPKLVNISTTTVTTTE